MRTERVDFSGYLIDRPDLDNRIASNKLLVVMGPVDRWRPNIDPAKVEAIVTVVNTDENYIQCRYIAGSQLGAMMDAGVPIELTPIVFDDKITGFQSTLEI